MLNEAIGAAMRKLLDDPVGDGVILVLPGQPEIDEFLIMDSVGDLEDCMVHPTFMEIFESAEEGTIFISIRGICANA